MSDFIPYGRQVLSQVDVDAVTRVLHSDFLTSGPEVEIFEEEFAAHVGARFAVAVNSGTAALHLALLAANVGAGDRVMTSPITFLASANCAAYVGAVPDFADIDPVTPHLSPESLRDNWKEDTRAVIAVDYAGQAADMPSIADVARARGAVVIEDACHGVGGAFVKGGREYRLGGHPWADMTVFSFHPVKSMTTGEGGMLVTNNPAYAAAARRLRSHGVVRNNHEFQGLGVAEGPLSEVGPWVYEMQELGYNYRITDLQCALGRSQLKQLPDFIKRRQEIVRSYNAAFAQLDWIFIPQLRNPDDADYISWHLYTVLIDYSAVGISRAELMKSLRLRGVGSQVLYIPVYLQPWYRKQYGYAQGKCPIAEDFYSKTLSLPLYPGLTDAQVDHVIQAVQSFQ